MFGRHGIAITGHRLRFSGSACGLAAQKRGFSTEMLYTAPIQLVEQQMVGLSTVVPWWGAIVLTPILLRPLISFPFQIYSQQLMCRREHMMHELSNQMEYLHHDLAMNSRDNATANTRLQILRKEVRRRLQKSYRVQTYKAFIPAVGMIPGWLAISLAIRQAIEDHASAMEVGGTLLFHDLTVPSQMPALSVLLGCVYLLNIELTLLKSPVASGSRRDAVLRKVLPRSLTGLLFLSSLYAPSGLTLFWIASGACRTFEHFFFNQAQVRRLLGIRYPFASAKQVPKDLLK